LLPFGPKLIARCTKPAIKQARKGINNRLPDYENINHI